MVLESRWKLWPVFLNLPPIARSKGNWNICLFQNCIYYLARLFYFRNLVKDMSDFEMESAGFLRKNTGNPYTVYPKKDPIERNCINELKKYDAYFTSEHWV